MDNYIRDSLLNGFGFGMLICLLCSLTLSPAKGQTALVNQNTPITLTGEVSLTFNDVSLVNDGDIVFLDTDPKTISIYGNESAENHSFGGLNDLGIFNFIMNKSGGGLSLKTDVLVFGQAVFDGGILVLEEDAVFNISQFLSDATISESENSRITGENGSVLALIELNQPDAENIANMGLVISSTADLGNTEIIRRHAPVAINGSEGIARTFEIKPENNADLNATLRFYYFDGELNGNDESLLEVFQQIDTDLVKMVVTERNTDENWIEIAPVDQLTTFVIGADPCGLIDATVTLRGKTLTASEPGATYQWIDCDNGNAPIDGATGQSFEAQASGNYAVIISTEDCEVTSLCTFVDVEACNTSSESTIEACDSYTWLDMTFTESGTYTATLPNTVGCDSLLTLNLTINTVDTEIAVDESSLTSAEQNATYQWLDCNNNNVAIAGANAQTFTPEAAGSYAVEIISQEGCIAISDCQQLDIILGIEGSWVGDIKLYPNPVENQFSIILDQTYSGVELQLRDSRGILIEEKEYKNSARIEYNFNAPPGLYLIELITGGKRATLTIQKN